MNKSTLKALCFLLLNCIMAACQKETTGEDSRPEDKTKTSITLEQISPDTLMLQPNAFSGEGFFRLSGNSIYFFDKIFFTVTEFDTAGTLLTTHLGRGTGPQEILEFEWANILPDGRLVFTNSNYMLLTYSPGFEFKNKAVLDFGTENRVYDDTDVQNTGAYRRDYMISLYGNDWLAANGNYVFLPVTINDRINKSLGYFKNYQEYIKQTRILSRVNLATGHVEFIFGRHDRVYLQKPTVVHDFVVADIKADKLFTTQAAAEKIVVYNLSGKAEYTFGRAGKDMRTDYVYTASFDETAEKIRDLNRQYGFYYHLYADTGTNLVFRSYSRGNSSTGGLQIYRGTTLIADVDVPLRFNVVGRIGHYYYADGLVEEEPEKLGIYRFRLEL